RGGRLVAARDHPQAGGVVHRIERGDVALARDAEHGVDAVGRERVDEHLAAGSKWHERWWSAAGVAASSGGNKHPMFLFFSNRMGCVGSLLVSALLTLVIVV